MKTIVRRALLTALLMLTLLTIAADGLPLLTAAPEAAAQTPAATPDATLDATPAASTGVSAAEQALADKYVPIAMLRTQPEDCSPVGEPYVPIAVEITLDNPDVTLRRRRQAGESSDPVLITAPSAADLANLDPGFSYYLDLPGKSLDPGCVYEEWSRARAAELGLEPSVYAYIATEPDRPGKLALQYWFHYAFDDFNNSHESDWEMIQLTFDADTAEQALEQEPSLLSYAQHGGGENADWGDANVLMKDGRLLTYPAEGSHATYYQDAIWLAWGEGGSGFGCDQAQEELTEVPLQAIVIPRDIDPNGPFAWTLFEGRWGEYHPWEFNGPLSPNVGDKWLEPISWTDDLRAVSFPVPHATTFGPGPSEFFCSLATLGGELAKRVQVAPRLILGLVGFAVAALLLTTFLTRRFLGRAIALYARNWPTFVLSSVVLLAVAAATTWARNAIHHTVLADWVSGNSAGESSVAGALDSGGVGLLLQFMLAGLVAPGVIAATAEIVSSRQTDYVGSLRRSLERIPAVLGALIYNYIITVLLTLTLVLIPYALYRQVQWAYAPHAVVIDDAGVRNSRRVSRDTIKGDWLRTLGMAVLVNVVAGIPGPVVGLALILLQIAPLEVAGYVSSLVFAIVYPVTVIASTLYYLWRRDERAARLASGAPAPTGFWRNLLARVPGRRDRAPVSEPVREPSAAGGSGA